MSIHELDEHEPCPRAKHLLAGDAEQTAVRFDIPTRNGGIILGSATVNHDGEKVVNVILPPHFRDWAGAAGLERDDLCFEGYLEAMAKMVFARGATHLTCRKCGLERAAPDASRFRCSAPAHDWIVAR